MIKTEGKMEQLIEQAKGGDQKAMAEIYRLNHPFVYNYILKRVQNTTDAEDLTSKVFVRAIEKLEQYSYRPGRGFPNWLARIAHNLIVDEWRKQRRNNLFADIPEHLMGVDFSAEEVIVSLDTAEFEQCLTSCTSQQAKVMRLKYIHDLSNEQIAKELGTSIGAIKSMQHRAFENMRAGL